MVTAGIPHDLMTSELLADLGPGVEAAVRSMDEDHGRAGPRRLHHELDAIECGNRRRHAIKCRARLRYRVTESPRRRSQPAHSRLSLVLRRAKLAVAPDIRICQSACGYP